MRLNITQLTLPALLVMTTIGCSKGFQASPGTLTAASVNAATGAPNQPSGGNGTTTGKTWDEIDLGGTLEGGLFDKTSVVQLDKQNKTLIVRLPVLANPFLNGMSAALPIAQLPGASLKVETGSDMRMSIVMTLPLSTAVHGIKTLPVGKLPNGDALPGVPGGEMPQLGVQMDVSHKINASLYLSPSVVGLFVSSPINPFISTMLPIRNKEKTKILGYFSTVPAKGNGVDGGFFLSIQIPDDIARAIDDNL